MIRRALMVTAQKLVEGLEIANHKLKPNEHLFMNAVQEMATGNVKVEGEDVMDLEGDEG